MTHNEFERLRIFLKVHNPRTEEYSVTFEMQDGSLVGVDDPKTMYIENETFFYDKKKSVHRKDIKRPRYLWTCSKAPFSRATYF